MEDDSTAWQRRDGIRGLGENGGFVVVCRLLWFRNYPDNKWLSGRFNPRPSPRLFFLRVGGMPGFTKSKVSSPPPIVSQTDQSRIATITSSSHLLSAPLHVVTGRGAFHPSMPEPTPLPRSSTQTYPLGCLWVSQQDVRPIVRSKDSRLR